MQIPVLLIVIGLLSGSRAQLTTVSVIHYGDSDILLPTPIVLNETAASSDASAASDFYSALENSDYSNDIDIVINDIFETMTSTFTPTQNPTLVYSSVQSQYSGSSITVTRSLDLQILEESYISRSLPPLTLPSSLDSSLLSSISSMVHTPVQIVPMATVTDFYYSVSPSVVLDDSVEASLHSELESMMEMWQATATYDSTHSTFQTSFVRTGTLSKPATIGEFKMHHAINSTRLSEIESALSTSINAAPYLTQTEFIYSVSVAQPSGIMVSIVEEPRRHHRSNLCTFTRSESYSLNPSIMSSIYSVLQTATALSISEEFSLEVANRLCSVTSYPAFALPTTLDSSQASRIAAAASGLVTVIPYSTATTGSTTSYYYTVSPLTTQTGCIPPTYVSACPFSAMTFSSASMSTSTSVSVSTVLATPLNFSSIIATITKPVKEYVIVNAVAGNRKSRRLKRQKPKHQTKKRADLDDRNDSNSDSDIDSIEDQLRDSIAGGTGEACALRKGTTDKKGKTAKKSKTVKKNKTAKKGKAAKKVKTAKKSKGKCQTTETIADSFYEATIPVFPAEKAHSAAQCKLEASFMDKLGQYIPESITTVFATLTTRDVRTQISVLPILTTRTQVLTETQYMPVTEVQTAVMYAPYPVAVTSKETMYMMKPSDAVGGCGCGGGCDLNANGMVIPAGQLPPGVFATPVGQVDRSRYDIIGLAGGSGGMAQNQGALFSLNPSLAAAYSSLTGKVSWTTTNSALIIMGPTATTTLSRMRAPLSSVKVLSTSASLIVMAPSITTTIAWPPTASITRTRTTGFLANPFFF